MMSAAGQLPATGQTQQNQQQQSQQYAGLMAPMMYGPAMLPTNYQMPGGMPGFNLKLTGDDLVTKGTNGAADKLSPQGELVNQQMWNQFGLNIASVGLNCINSFLNFGLGIHSMNKQYDAMSDYYKSQETIAGYQQTVALRQIGVQEKAIDAQSSIMRDNFRTQESIARLEKSAECRLARIQEDGKTDRAKIMSAIDTFKNIRRGRSMGTPEEMWWASNSYGNA